MNRLRILHRPVTTRTTRTLNVKRLTVKRRTRPTTRRVQTTGRRTVISRPMIRQPVRRMQRPNGRGHEVQPRVTTQAFGLLNSRRTRSVGALRGVSRVRRPLSKPAPTPPPVLRVVKPPAFDVWKPPSTTWTHPFGVLNETPVTLAAFYKNKLNPVLGSFDLHDKTLRAFIVNKYVLKDKSAMYDTFMAASLTDAIPFPKRLGPAFVISIRKERLEAFHIRLGPWVKYVQHWPGVHGSTLNQTQLFRDGVLTKNNFHDREHQGEQMIRRGEIGCYLSHYGIWQHIVKNNIPYATIFEDDATFAYCEPTANRLNRMFADLDKHDIQYELIYLGHNNFFKPVRVYANTELAVPPTECQGLFAYLVTLEGARKLLNVAMPIGPPVDIHVARQDQIKQLRMEPRLAWVVEWGPNWSDTYNIK